MLSGGHIKTGAIGSKPESPPEASIDLLPEELLLCIFKTLVEYNPLYIGKLLFVSRYWHHIVRSTPSLWSKILIKLCDPTDIVKFTHYIIGAHTNSTTLLLDVTIDLFDLYTYLGNHQNEIEQHKRDLGRLFQHVVGHKGANLARWRSLRLRLQNHYHHGFSQVEATVKGFVKELNHPTPHLEALFLHLNSANILFPRLGGPLQDLRSLKHLIMDAGGHLGHLKYMPEKIETLSFRLWGSTNVMAPFINLRKLSISSVPNGGITHEDDPAVTFPLLECLTLDVWSPWRGVGPATQLARKIRAPILETLRLLDDQGLLSVGNANAFHQVRALDLLSSESSPDGILEFIASHLYKYTELTSLTVCHWHLESVMQRLVILVKDQGRVPTGLEVIYAVISNREGVILDHKGTGQMFSLWRSTSDYIYRPHTLRSHVVRQESVAR